MKATVFGASGLIGSNLIHYLLESSEYSQVYRVIRKSDGLKHSKLIDILWNNEQLPPEIYQVDSLFCCLGTTIKKAGTKEAFKAVDYHLPLLLAKQFKLYSDKKFLVVTALGSDANSKIFYNQVKGELEKDLNSLGLKDLTIVRPSLLIGERNESRPGEKLAQLISPVLSPFLIGPVKKYRPIKGKEVAGNLYRLSLGQLPKDHMEYEVIKK